MQRKSLNLSQPAAITTVEQAIEKAIITGSATVCVYFDANKRQVVIREVEIRSEIAKNIDLS